MRYDDKNLLPTTFEIALPGPIERVLDNAFDTYCKMLLVAPILLCGKIVVEQTDLPVAGATHIIRKLVTADFDKKQKMSATDMLSVGYGKQERGYWESWMGVLTGAASENERQGFKVHQLQVYVHREGGWMLVHNHVGKTDQPIHENGDPWPEPAGDPPANKGVINTASAYALQDKAGFEQLAEMVKEMIEAGGQMNGDELLIDFRNEKQRRRFWAYNAEVKKLWPGI